MAFMASFYVNRRLRQTKPRENPNARRRASRTGPSEISTQTSEVATRPSQKPLIPRDLSDGLDQHNSRSGGLANKCSAGHPSDSALHVRPNDCQLRNKPTTILDELLPSHQTLFGRAYMIPPLRPVATTGEKGAHRPIQQDFCGSGAGPSSRFCGTFGPLTT